jgi:CRP/FNR family cyclic AMP-dependent transcriptional regulator
MPIPLTQSDLGILANASRKQVNAAVNSFATAGWVTSTYWSITVANPEALRKFSDGEKADI